MGKIVFIHPDLGIGGAERAVIDTALALKSRGHEVEFVTAHHDPSHCFQETKDGTFQVTSVGDWLPRNSFGYFSALWAYVRMIYAALYLVFFSSIKYDLIFCDQISACIPVLRFSKARIIFYCHFPDMLLTKRSNLLKRLYRAPIDYLEEKTTGMADCLLVNSEFTAGIFHDTFKSLQHVQPQVLYPIPSSSSSKPVSTSELESLPVKAETMYLSINRYERKKNLPLAIHAFANLLKQCPDANIHLIIAGGYDERVTENVTLYNELVTLAEENELKDKITFLRSFSDTQKTALLKSSTCLIYTPENEHFGIVPIEAMSLGCPVIAMNSGGPLETVDDGVTGFLCPNDPKEVAAAMKKFLDKPQLVKSFGEAGKRRVNSEFSFEQFTNKINNIVNRMIPPGEQ